MASNNPTTVFALPATFTNNATSRRQGVIAQVTDILGRADDDDDDVTFEFLLKVVRELQGELTAANEEILQLRRQVADFALSKVAKGSASRKESSSASPSPSTKSTLDPAEQRQGSAIKDGATLNSHISPQASYFCLFHTPSVMTVAFSIPKPAFSPDSLARFPGGVMKIPRDSQTGAMVSPYDDANYVAGVTSELYSSLPAAFHDYMAKSNVFPKKFIGYVQGARSNHLTRLRDNGAKIFGIEQSLFENPSQRLADPTVRNLIGYTPGAPNSDYMFLPPVYYRNFDRSNQSGLFLSEPLIKIALILINGPKSSAPKANSPYFHRDRVTTTTIGLISVVAAYAVYTLSDDTKFFAKGGGNVTSINYLAMIHYSKSVIVTVRERNQEWYTSLLSFWNSRVFPRLDEMLGASEEHIDLGLDDDIEDLIQSLDREMALGGNQVQEPVAAPPLAADDDIDDDDSFYVNEAPQDPAPGNPSAPLMPQPAAITATQAINTMTPTLPIAATTEPIHTTIREANPPASAPAPAKKTKPKPIPRRKTPAPAAINEAEVAPENSAETHAPAARRITRSHGGTVAGKRV